jgi:hypothetical protein
MPNKIHHIKNPRVLNQLKHKLHLMTHFVTFIGREKRKKP